MKLVIVESPAKARTIVKYLGKDYKVLASVGHIRDLATSGKDNFGVDVDNNFEPDYQVSLKKTKVVSMLEKAVSEADEVYLATDPDREGEAISWHLADTLHLNVDSTKRLEFHEITPYGIKNALNNVRTIDMKLVSSQETRRIVDRIMGFKLSSLLQKKIKSPSAGRVQSAVLKLVVEREKEILNFVSEEYWNIEVEIKKDQQLILAKLIKINNENFKISNEEEVKKVIDKIQDQLQVQRFEKENKMYYSRAPFITSSLQQEMFNKHRITPTKTMKIAQSLYEGVNLGTKTLGLITYMRTDSIRLSPVFINSTKRFIEENYGEQYVGVAKSQGGSNRVQDAHEAIRPTDIKLTPSSIKEFLDAEQFKVYAYIWTRTVASMMKPRIMNITNVDFSSNELLFNAQCSELVFDGYSKIYQEYEDFKVNESFVFAPQEIVERGEIIPTQSFTKPPYRYSEARLIKAMEDLGIGRPSTYAQTMYTIKIRNYVNSVKGYLIPTKIGILTSEKLEEFFSSFINYEYTAKMETELDLIAEGQTSKLEILNGFYDKFIDLVNYADDQMEKVEDEKTGELCPNCSKPLVLKNGPYGEFIGCSDYPTCRYIKKEQSEQEVTDKHCPKCEEGMLVKRKGRYGYFLGCNKYPSCKYMEKFIEGSNESVPIEIGKKKSKKKVTKKKTTKKVISKESDSKKSKKSSKKSTTSKTFKTKKAEIE